MASDRKPLNARRQEFGVRSVKRILGIDPGLARTGWGVIETAKDRLILIEYGCITTPADQPTPERLQAVYRQLRRVLARYRPAFVSIEKLFFARNVTSAFAVGQARGVAFLACAHARRPTVEVSPTTVKLALTGYGHADKVQIQKMIKLRLRLRELPAPDDAADAIAVAMCAAKMKPNDEHLTANFSRLVVSGQSSAVNRHPL